MSEEIMSYLRILTVFMSVFYGLWQHFQKRKLENFIANKAIALSKSIAIALGATQNAKTSIQNSISVSNEIGRAEGLLNAALVDSADLYCNLKKPTLDDIDELAKSNETINAYQGVFNMFSDRRIGYIRKFGRWITKLY